MSFHGGVEALNGDVCPSEGLDFWRTSGRWVYGLVQLAKWFLSGFWSIQHSPIISSPGFTCHFKVQPIAHLPPCLPPPCEYS